MKQYYFNFRKGDEISRDGVGMHLPDLDAARAEALRMWRDVVEIATRSGEALADAEIQITDTDGETVLAIALGEQTRFLKEAAPAPAESQKQPSRETADFESTNSEPAPEMAKRNAEWLLAVAEERKEPARPVRPVRPDVPIDRAVLEKRIAQAERIVHKGQRHIARQREIVRKSRTRCADGTHFALSEQLLATFEDSLLSEQYYLERLRQSRRKAVA